MHYCIAVVTDRFPTDDILSRKMAPFDEDAYYRRVDEDEMMRDIPHPQFLWDWYSVGGRYCGKIKLKVNSEEENEYEWGFYAKKPRAGRLFRSMMLENRHGPKSAWFREEEWYPYIGYRDGYLRVDGAKIRDILEFDETITNCWGFVGKEGEAYSRDYWNGDKWLTDDQFEEKVKESVKDSEDCYLTFIDIHD